MKKRDYGSGRTLYWAHAAGPTERRGSVRSGDTAYELMPLATPRTPYENVLLVDMGTHPRLIPADVLLAMLPPGIHMTDLARQAMPGIDAACITPVMSATGERVWTVLDTTCAFQSYWNDAEPDDATPEAIAAAFARLRTLAHDVGHMPLGTFPIPYPIVVGFLRGHMATLDAVFARGFDAVQSLTQLSANDVALAFRIMESTLSVRTVERADVADGISTAARR